MTLFSGSFHDLDNANVPCWEFFHFFFDIHDKSSCLWRFSCSLAVNQVQLLASDPRTGYRTLSCMTLRHLMKIYTPITSHTEELETWARCHCVVLWWRIDWYASLHAWTLSGQVICPDLRLNFQNDLSGQNANVSIRLNATNTMGFRIFLFILLQSFLQKRWSYLKSNFLFDLPWKVKQKKAR